MPHMLVRIRTRTAFFRVGFLAICLNVKYLSRDDTGRLLKSPYLLRARTRVVLMQVVDKNVVIAGWRFVDCTGNQTGENTIQFMGLR